VSRHRGREFWEQLCAEVDGGEASAEVARRHRVKVATLRWWRWRLGQPERAVAKQGAPVLLPVVVRDSAPARAGHVELLAGGVVLRFAVGTDIDYIARLAAELERAC